MISKKWLEEKTDESFRAARKACDECLQAQINAVHRWLDKAYLFYVCYFYPFVHAGDLATKEYYLKQAHSVANSTPSSIKSELIAQCGLNIDVRTIRKAQKTWKPSIWTDKFWEEVNFPSLSPPLSLWEQMQHAIAEENYEKAAELKLQIDFAGDTGI